MEHRHGLNNRRFASLSSIILAGICILSGCSAITDRVQLSAFSSRTEVEKTYVVVNRPLLVNKRMELTQNSDTLAELLDASVDPQTVQLANQLRLDLLENDSSKKQLVQWEQMILIGRNGSYLHIPKFMLSDSTLARMKLLPDDTVVTTGLDVPAIFPTQVDSGPRLSRSGTAFSAAVLMPGQSQTVILDSDTASRPYYYLKSFEETLPDWRVAEAIDAIIVTQRAGGSIHSLVIPTWNHHDYYSWSCSRLTDPSLFGEENQQFSEWGKNKEHIVKELYHVYINNNAVIRGVNLEQFLTEIGRL